MRIMSTMTILNKSELEQIWASVLNNIQLEVSPANFQTWFRDTHLIRFYDDTMYVGVPSVFVGDWMRNKFQKLILKNLRDMHPAVRNVEFSVSSARTGKKKSTADVRHTQPAQTLEQTQTGLPLRKKFIQADGLREHYTFENFVVGSFNDLAYSASQAIIKKPATYNPFFIYGPTGLGKTHLIQAIGNKMKENNQNMRVLYTSSEGFFQDYVNALGNNTVQNYKNKYRSYELLIMDDVQFLASKQKAQEELFHLFNVLYHQGNQIIFSSDKHPAYIPGLEDRLKSRFAAGMIIDIGKPDTESRVAILSKKLKELSIPMPDKSILYIAEHVEGNIRELEGIVNLIECHYNLRNRLPDQADLRNLIKNTVKSKGIVSASQIVKIVAEFYNLAEKDIYGKTRKKEIVHGRQVIMYLLREDYSFSLPVIGTEIGKRDHTTVIHSCERVKEMLSSRPSFANELEQIRAILS